MNVSALHRSMDRLCARMSLQLVQVPQSALLNCSRDSFAYAALPGDIVTLDSASGPGPGLDLSSEIIIQTSGSFSRISTASGISKNTMFSARRIGFVILREKKQKISSVVVTNVEPEFQFPYRH